MATLQDFIGGGIPAGLLDPAQMQAAEQRAQNSALINTFFSVLQASRGQPGQGRPGLGQIVGQAGPVGLQAYQQSFDKTLADTLKNLQVQDLLAKRKESEQIRRLAPQLFQTTRAPSQTIYDVEGETTIPGAITGVSVNRELLPALGALGPAGMEYASKVAEFEKSLRPERVTLKPGEQVIEPSTGRVVAKVAPTPDKVDLGTHIAFYDPQNPSKPIITLPKGKDPKDLTSTELQVGGQFNTQASPFISIGQNYKKIETAAKNPSAAGDISLIFGYMKLLDPTSVVREGEFATAQNAGSVPDRIFALYNKALTGETLKSNIREDFVSQAKNLVRSQQEIYKQTIEPRFDSIVQSANLNKQNVMFNPFAGIDLTPSQTPPSAPEVRKIPTIQEQMQGGVMGGITVRRIKD
jgi:hypothetical protein